MRNRAFLKVVLLGLLTFALAPGLAGAASQGQDLTGMLSSSAAERATAVSGPVISVSPTTHDFGRVNVGTTAGPFNFTVSNTGDATLNISTITHSTAGFSTSLSSMSIAPGGSAMLSASYSPVGSGPQTDNVTIMSDASNGNFVVLLSGIANNAPTIDCAQRPPNPNCDPLQVSYDLSAFSPFQLIVQGHDMELDPVIWSAMGLPLGATFGMTQQTDATGTSTATLNWTPDGSQAGTYPITVEINDGAASSNASFSLVVTVTNRPPVANAGGPYVGVVGTPLQFDGTGSFDPDAGQTLTFDWDFGDGQVKMNGGATPTNTYLAAGNFIVNLRVTDNGSPSLFGLSQTTASIVTSIPASIILKLPGSGVMRAVGGNGTQLVGMEVSGRPLTDIDPNTIRMRVSNPPNAGSVSEISILSKSISIGDMDHDGVPDLDVAFSRSDLHNLLSNVTNGTIVTLMITARTTAATGNLPVVGSPVDVKVKTSSGPAAVTSAVAPNPFKPETSIEYSVRNTGPVSIRIFSVNGQLVRSLREDYATPGSYEVRWNGKDDAGRTAPSGIYFVSVRQGSASSMTRVVVAR